MHSARIGFIGLGNVAHVHAEAYRAHPGLELVAGFDVDPARTRTFCDQHGITDFSSLEDMLKEERLEVACVLTPARFHEQAVLACAAAGVNVLCEKPLALSVDACDRMIGACREAKVSLCYGASYRYLPALAKAKELIDSGEIGELLVLRESAVGGTGVASRGTMGSVHYPDGGPGGSAMGLIDHGIHLIDLFSWLTGAPVTRAVGRGNVAGREQQPEYLVLEFANGAIGELIYEDGTFPSELPSEGIFSWGRGWDVGGLAPLGQWQPHPGAIHVHGTRGALRIIHYGNALFLRNQTGLRQIKVSDDGAPAHFALQMKSFIEALRAGQPAPVSAEVGREACRLVLSVYE